MLRLAELVLTLNCFTFSGETFKQINGVAMGTKMGPNYANLFVGYVEEQIFNQFDGPKPDLERFIGFVNSFQPSNSHGKSLQSLNISVQDNKLATSVHYKPTDSHSYLLYSVKDSIP